MSNQKLERAKRVLESLVQGSDPISGADLSTDTVLNRIEVNRALIIAVTAIEEKAARAGRRAQLPSGIGRTWSPDEEKALSAEFKRGEPIAEIAKRHNRTARAIEARLGRMGLIASDKWMTYHPRASLVIPKKQRSAK